MKILLELLDSSDKDLCWAEIKCQLNQCSDPRDKNEVEAAWLLEIMDTFVGIFVFHDKRDDGRKMRERVVRFLCRFVYAVQLYVLW